MAKLPCFISHHFNLGKNLKNHFPKEKFSMKFGSNPKEIMKRAYINIAGIEFEYFYSSEI